MLYSFIGQEKDNLQSTQNSTFNRSSRIFGDTRATDKQSLRSSRTKYSSPASSRRGIGFEEPQSTNIYGFTNQLNKENNSLHQSNYLNRSGTQYSVNASQQALGFQQIDKKLQTVATIQSFLANEQGLVQTFQENVNSSKLKIQNNFDNMIKEITHRLQDCEGQCLAKLNQLYKGYLMSVRDASSAIKQIYAQKSKLDFQFETPEIPSFRVLNNLENSFNTLFTDEQTFKSNATSESYLNQRSMALHAVTENIKQIESFDHQLEQLCDSSFQQARQLKFQLMKGLQKSGFYTANETRR